MDRGAFETSLTVAVLIFLIPFFLKFVALERGRDDRFAKPHTPTVDLPEPLLPKLCASHGGHLGAADLRIICPRTNAPSTGALDIAMWEIERQSSAIHSSYALPVALQTARIQALLNKRQEGLGDWSEAGDEFTALETELKPFYSRFRLDVASTPYPRSLVCIEPVFRKALEGSTSDTDRFLLTFWYAGVLDGTDQKYVITPPEILTAYAPECLSFGTFSKAVDEARAVMNDAFESKSEAIKADAMRTLMTTAWWQFPAWALVGLLFVKLARQSSPIAPKVGLALMVWSALAWLSHVYLKVIEDRHLGWTDQHAIVHWLPTTTLIGMMALGFSMQLMSFIGRQRSTPAFFSLGNAPAQAVSSRVGYAGLVACLGIGWLVLLDLSAGAHPRNRFLGLYQQGIVWGGFFVVSLSAVLRPALGRGATRLLALLSLSLTSLQERSRWSLRVATVAFLIVMALFFGVVLHNYRQFTSEVGRLWLILGAAGFFYLRGEFVGDLATKADWQRFLAFLSPLLLVVLVLGIAMLVTDDMGPLLVSIYASGVFIAAAVGARAQQSGQTGLVAFAWGAFILLVWVFSLTAGLFSVGGYHSTVASRIESAVNPLGAINDQLAIITWFRESIPLSGYGIGTAPWCGHATSGNCAGLPLQIQSDYTFTALAGVFGVAPTGLFCAGVFAWLWLLIRHHPRATTGRPDVGCDGSIDTRQAWLSWVVTAWVALTLCQLAITIAGNVGLLPLTGVTFPFVSYGMMSLWFNAFFFGLAVNIDKPGNPG